MNKVDQIIHSGKLELFVLGLASEEDQEEIALLALLHPEIQMAINRISDDIETHAKRQAVTPPPEVRAAILSAIQLSVNGEKKGAHQPPVLTASSTIEDFKYWLDDPKYALSASVDDIVLKPISRTVRSMTAIGWVKKEIPWEVHTHEAEEILVVEGSCDFYVEDKVYKLSAGSYFSVPLHRKHRAIVTSDIPCKFIVQRMAV